MPSPTILLLAAAVVLGIVHFIYTKTRKLKLPEGVIPLPGPRGLPLIGRVHDVPAEATWLKFYEWSKTYGPIYQMEMFGSVHVWISDEKIAHDLLAKRNAIYSDRPVIANLPDNRTSGDYSALLGRTETWKRQRKLTHHLMADAAKASLHGYPTRERDRFLYLLSRDSSNYVDLIEQFTSRTVSRLSWGSPHMAKVVRRNTAGLLRTISPAGALPNVVSWLARVPAALSPWKKREAARHALEARLLRHNVEYVERMRWDKTAQPSFLGAFLDEKEQAAAAAAVAGLDEKRAKWADTGMGEASYTVGLMAIAGAMTIGSPIQSYILAMCHYPDWQRKLQQEVDAVCEGRCPQWEDREKMPLLRAVIKEVMRWRPPVPTGIPHALEKDDVYNGYFIPAGATIHALEWGMTRNETTYPQPETFNPDRWLSPAFPETYREPLTRYPTLDGYSQFGFGRRTCQGLPIVEQDLFLAMGGLAWAFTMQKRRDPATGAEVPIPWNDFTALLIAKPVRFAFDAVPRGGAARRAELERMWEAAKEEDAELVVEADGSLRVVGGLDGEGDASESDDDVLITIRESSSEPE
ncbi:unnamed protein product [Discula destructiva]